MDFTSLSEVTNTLIAIIQAEVEPGGVTVKVLPEILRNAENGVGFYLYHVQENAQFKNFPSLGKDPNPISTTPMALNLYYQLSANFKVADKEDALEEQSLMTAAMKALHDNPVITTSNTGKKINIKVTLQTLSPSESVQYWAAAESPVRLSAYYEVSVVFLEPEKPKTYAGRVLSYGNYIFVTGRPNITASQSILQYSIPGDPEIKEILTQPAQATVGSKVSFSGSGFNAGSVNILISNSALWPEPKVADLAWGVTLVAQNQVDMTIQSVNQTDDILPGLYGGQVSVVEIRVLPNGSSKTFVHNSNVFPFSVMPNVINIIPNVPATAFTITGGVFQHALLTNNDVQLYLAANKLSQKTGAGALTNGEYRIVNATTIELVVPLLDVLSNEPFRGNNIPLRILVKGVESPPKWIDIP